ncbi:MAG: TIGR01212 family radical SAM protein [Candidatus Cloacimonadota bacterium]|nr:TIGR01212 family radical SAM protein [Candidatus Cloacimonadota bacterium]
MKSRLEDRIYTYSDYLKKKFGEKVFRVGLSTGIPCPHRIATGGCIFCDPQTFTGDYIRKVLSVQDQLNEIVPIIQKSCGKVKLLAYFQDETSTAGEIAVLKEKFQSALNFPDVLGLVVSTRPDYINVDIVKMLKQLEKPVTIEIGLQSVHNSSLEFLNRGHNFSQVDEAIQLCGENGLEVGVHLIMGIPGENFEDMKKTISYINDNEYIKLLKFHNLIVYKGTKLEKIISKEEIINIDRYIDLMTNLLGYLRGEKVITRLFTSNISPNQVAMGNEVGNKTKWMNYLRKKMIAKGIIQGCKTNFIYKREVGNV